jgi:xanthine/uracil/vitamin C permease (AzgA family)
MVRQGRIEVRRTFLAGWSLFSVTAYAPFTVAILIGKHGDPGLVWSYAVLAVCSIIIGTMLGTLLSGMSLIVAPAVGMATIFASTQAHDDKSAAFMSPYQFLLSAALAGSICLLLSIWKHDDTLSKRMAILNDIPPQIRQGVKAGVGTLLAASAVENVRFAGSDFIPLFCGLVAILLIASFAAQKIDLAPPVERREVLRFTLLKSLDFLIPVLLLAWFAHRGSSDSGQVQYTLGTIGDTLGNFWGSLSIGPISPPERTAILLKVASMTVVLTLILLVDIPGTLLSILSDMPAGDRIVDGMDESRAIRRSFIADSAMAMLNAGLMISPSIYYSENQVMIDHDHATVASKTPAVIAIVLYLAILTILLTLPPISVETMKNWAGIATAPVLFLVGIRLTARSLLSEHENPPETESPEDKIATITPDYYIPVAVTILVTHLASIEYGIQAGILSYCAYILFETRDGATTKGRIKPVIYALGLTSLFVVVVLLSLRTPQAEPDSTGKSEIAAPLST